MTKCTRPGCEEEARGMAGWCPPCWQEYETTVPDEEGQLLWRDWANAHPKPARIDWLLFVTAHNQAVAALTAERDKLAAEVEQLKDGVFRQNRLVDSQDAELRQLRELADAAVEWQKSLGRSYYDYVDATSRLSALIAAREKAGTAARE